MIAKSQSLSAYYVPYDFSDKRRSSLNILGLYVNLERGHHSLGVDLSEYRNGNSSRFRHDVAGIYTFQSPITPRYRIGLIYSETELDIDYPLTNVFNEELDLRAVYFAQSLGLVLGVGDDTYSENGFLRYTRGLDVYLSRHATKFQDYGDAQFSDQWALQLSGHFTLYGRGLDGGYMRYGFRQNFISLYEPGSISYDQQQQLELRIGHHWPRLSIDIYGWFGSASYSYQSGGYVSYNSSDKLKFGSAVELGWHFNSRLKGTLKLQEFQYADGEKDLYREDVMSSFRNALIMLSYRF